MNEGFCLSVVEKFLLCVLVDHIAVPLYMPYTNSMCIGAITYMSKHTLSLYACDLSF